jgi:hypothetical protein
MNPVTGRTYRGINALALAMSPRAFGVHRMVGEDPFGDPIGVGRGAKNLAFVVLADLDPGLDVACVIGNVAGQLECISHELAG